MTTNKTNIPPYYSVTTVPFEVFAVIRVIRTIMNLLKVKAFVFDFDGTLAVLNIDFSFMKERVFELIKRFGVNGESVKERYLLEIIDEVYSLLLRKKSPGAARFYQEAHLILHEVEMKAADKGKLIPGAEGALRTVKANGMKLGIVTRNCEEAVRKVFPEIDEFCDVFISRDSIVKVKPHPEHLAAALKALGIPAEEAVMIGDHVIDIQAGKRAGMKTIGVLTGTTRKEEFEQAGANYVLVDVSEICDLLSGNPENTPTRIPSPED
jgi:phosphoglycolate phosphatase